MFDKKKILLPILLCILILVVKFQSINFEASSSSSTGIRLVAQAEKKCFTFKDDLDERISKARVVFVTMPAKVGGTSMKLFGKSCGHTHYPDNFINDKKEVKNFLLQSVELPRIVVSHSYFEPINIRLAETTPNDVLTILLYREPSSRQVSAIKQVIKVRCKQDGGNKWFKTTTTKTHNETKCVVEDEKEFIENVGQHNLWELGVDTDTLYSCSFYDAIDRNNPNMVMVNYKKVNELQEVLAKHICPDVLDQLPFQSNTDATKKDKIYVRTKSGVEVPVDEWAESKRPFWNWAFDKTTTENNESTRCKARTRQLEKKMFTCEDQIANLRVDRR